MERQPTFSISCRECKKKHFRCLIIHLMWSSDARDNAADADGLSPHVDMSAAACTMLADRNKLRVGLIDCALTLQEIGAKTVVPQTASSPTLLTYCR